MKYLRNKDDIVLKIEKGEDVVLSIIELCKKEDIKCGSFTALGATSKVNIGFFNPMVKEYKNKEFTGDFEITSIVGNIARKDGLPILHSHITFSDEDYIVRGGHMNSCEVSVTCEIFIRVNDIYVERELDKEIGLNLLNIK